MNNIKRGFFKVLQLPVKMMKIKSRFIWVFKWVFCLASPCTHARSQPAFAPVEGCWVLGGGCQADGCPQQPPSAHPCSTLSHCWPQASPGQQPKPSLVTQPKAFKTGSAARWALIQEKKKKNTTKYYDIKSPGLSFSSSSDVLTGVTAVL